MYTVDGERPVHLEFRDPDGEPVDQDAVTIMRGPAYHAALAAAYRSPDGDLGADPVS